MAASWPKTPQQTHRAHQNIPTLQQAPKTAVLLVLEKLAATAHCQHAAFQQERQQHTAACSPA
jgi:hypothetical protein